jgi:hypothetical protein
VRLAGRRRRSGRQQGYYGGPPQRPGAQHAERRRASRAAPHPPSFALLHVLQSLLTTLRARARKRLNSFAPSAAWRCSRLRSRRVGVRARSAWRNCSLSCAPCHAPASDGNSWRVCTSHARVKVPEEARLDTSTSCRQAGRQAARQCTRPDTSLLKYAEGATRGARRETYLHPL